MSTLEDLKSEANDLGISYNKRIGEKKLQEKIEAFYESKETSGPAVAEVVKKEEAKVAKDAKSTPSKKFTPAEEADMKRIIRERIARKTRVISVVDNDQRINNHATTCTVNCSNEFFDLGTKLLPLNEKIEVSQGHINVLKSVQIPLHVKDTKTGLSTVRLRPRYTISYEDM